MEGGGGGEWWGGAVCGHLVPNLALILLVSKAAQTAHAVPLAGCWPVYLAGRDAGRDLEALPSTVTFKDIGTL